MLVGAFAAAAVGQATGSLALGLLAALVAGAGLSLLVGAASVLLRSDVFVAGLAANLLAPGLVSVLSGALYGTKGVLAAGAIASGAPLSDTLSSLPLVGHALFGQDILFYLLAAVSLSLAALYSRTVFGLRLRASGEPAETARAAGLDPARYRLAAHLVAGAASGLAGAYLAARIGAFVPGISSGRGWIALVAVYLGGRSPRGVLAASLCFGLLIALSNAAQGFAILPAELLQALPYLATAVALVAWKRAGKRA
jgi:simple sugar transport system permease protein